MGLQSYPPDPTLFDLYKSVVGGLFPEEDLRRGCLPFQDLYDEMLWLRREHPERGALLAAALDNLPPVVSLLGGRSPCS